VVKGDGIPQLVWGLATVWTAGFRVLTRARDVRFEVFTAVTMKNTVFWAIIIQFVLHRKHITYPLQGLAG
jgi:hypothetical protein